LLAQRRVRLVEVARAGPSTLDGIAVLQDTRTPLRLHPDPDEHGFYPLSAEHRRNGVMPTLPVTQYLRDLALSDVRPSSCRSYGFDLLRWFRSLARHQCVARHRCASASLHATWETAGLGQSVCQSRSVCRSAWRLGRKHRSREERPAGDG
jgi:hypothetical protein